MVTTFGDFHSGMDGIAFVIYETGFQLPNATEFPENIQPLCSASTGG